MDLLAKLARATDTKGYPDDKDPEHWRTINHSHVHLDANGNVDGGANKKFDGNQWNSQKHPHNPGSYKKAEPPAPPPPPKPAPTTEDLLNAWKKVVKYQVAMKQGKSQATWEKHAVNMKNAISEYEKLKAEAPTNVQKSHNPKLDLAKQFSDLPYGAFTAAKKGQAPAQPATDPLQAFANATNPPTPEPSALLKDEETIKSNLIYLYGNIPSNKKAAAQNYFDKWVDMVHAVEKASNDMSPENIKAAGEAYDAYQKTWSAALGNSPKTALELKTAQKWSLNDTTGNIADDINDFALYCKKGQINSMNASMAKNGVKASIEKHKPEAQAAPIANTSVQQYINAWNQIEGLVEDFGDQWKLTDEIKNAKKADDLLKILSQEQYDKYSLEEKKQLWKNAGSKSLYMYGINQLNDIVEKVHQQVPDLFTPTNPMFMAKHAPGTAGAATSPLGALNTAIGKQGMAAFPNGLKSAGKGKNFKLATDAEIKKAQNASQYSSNETYQKLGAESGKVWKKATKKEKAAAYEYTYSYSKYNEPLRGKEYYGSEKGVGNVDFDNVYDNPNQRAKTEALTNLIHKTSLGEARMVYRATGIDGMDKAFNIPKSLLQGGDEADLKAALNGLEWTDHGFGSVGADKGSGFTGKIKMEIYAPKGTKGIYAEPFSKYGQGEGDSWNGEPSSYHNPGSENEIILQRGTRYKIMDVKKVGGQIKLVMQIISQDPYELP